MHAANLIDAASGRELCGVVDLLEDPQAAIASTHQVIASAITRACRAEDVVSLRRFAHRRASAGWPATSPSWTTGNTGVTPSRLVPLTQLRDVTRCC
jgi:hypothetical protein